MGQYTIDFSDEPRGGIDLPNALLSDGGWYELKVISGDVFITGNEHGLLFLAEVLTRAAKSVLPEQYHIHLPLDSVLEGVEPSKVQEEVVIFGASESRL